MNTKSLQPEVQNFEFHPLASSTGVGDLVQDTSIKEQAVSIFQGMIGQSPVAVAATAHDKITLQVIHYAPTLFGDDNGLQVNTALADFYNKVTGSALQSTSISYADLGAFILYGREGRALIKDIDRALTIYNTTCIINPVYGRHLVDSIYGTGVYAVLQSHADAICRLRNKLAEKFNVQFPMPQGIRLTAIDDLCLDNIYVDDPDAKGSIIAFSRNGYNLYAVTSGPLIHLESLNFWSILSNTSLEWDARVNGILNNIDDFIQSTWFLDVRPYIENLQRKGGFRQDAGISENYVSMTGNRTFKPVYSSDVIDMIRNAPIVGRAVTGSGNGLNYMTVFEENASGYLEDIRTYKPILMVSGGGPANTSYVFDLKNKNLESYPAADVSMRKALAFDCKFYCDSSTSFNFKLKYATSAIITGITYYYCKSGDASVVQSKFDVINNFAAVSTGTVPPSWVASYSISWLQFKHLLMLTQLNSAPRLYFTLGAYDATTTANTIFNEMSSNLYLFMTDVDNVVVVSDEMYTNYYTLLAYEAIYNSDAVSAVAGK